MSYSTSAGRALDVMALFGRERRPLRAMEVVAEFGLPASSADQLLKSLVQSDHLVFDRRTKTYLPTMQLASFGSWLGEIYGAGDRLMRALDDLAADTRELVTVTISINCAMHIVGCRLSAGESMGLRGNTFPMIGSVAGGAVLATCDDGEVLRMVKRARRMGAPMVDYDTSLLEKLRAFRDAEYASGDPTRYSILSEGEPYWCLAVPVRRKGGMPMALGLGGPAGRVRGFERDYARLLQERARDAMVH